MTQLSDIYNGSFISGGEWSTHQTFENSTLTTITSTAVSGTWDLEENQITTLSLEYNGTLTNPTNKSSTGHAVYTLIVKNYGSYTLDFDTDYLFADGETPTMTVGTSGTPGVDILNFICDGTNMYGAAAANFS